MVPLLLILWQGGIFLFWVSVTFLLRLSCFPRGLAKSFFLDEVYVCFLVFCYNLVTGVESVIGICLVPKHPADVTFKKETRVLLDKLVCPEVPCVPFLKSTCVLFETRQVRMLQLHHATFGQIAKAPNTAISSKK